MEVVIQLFIVFLFSGILYLCAFLARQDPTVIAGFKWGDTPEEIERDKRWLGLFDRLMTLSAKVALAGGVLSVMLGSGALLLVFLFVPFLAPVYCAVVAPKKNSSSGSRKLAKLFALVGIGIFLLVGGATVYHYVKDLDVSLEDDRLEIKGAYGVTIAYKDIQRVEERPSLPAISLRVNGFSVGDTNLGRFRTEAGREVTLFTHSDSCLIFIEDRRRNHYYLSKERASDTKKLYDGILGRLAGK